MSDKKHIDRIFQEKLKDFEATPDKAVWDNISSQLNQKKKNRKVIPFWWKLTGVAASLILLLTVGNLIFNDSKITTNAVDTEKIDSNNKKVDENNNAIVNIEKENLEDTIDESSNKSLIKDDDTIQPETSNKNVVNTDESEAQKNPIAPKSDRTNIQNKKTNYLVNTDKKEVPKPNKSSQQPSNVINNTIKSPSLNQEKNKEVLVENNSKEPVEIEEKPSENSINNSKEKLAINTDEEQIPNNKDGILINPDGTEKEEQLVVEQEEVKTPLIEEVIADNENIIEEEKEVINRWQLNPNVAPVYFNSFGKGSSIHSQLAENDKTGEVNMSYGINVSYAVNNKLSIKSGINRVNLGYNTNDIIIYENVTGTNNNSDLFRNIKPKENLPQLSFVSGNDFAFAQSPSIVPNESNVLLNQEMTFYEIPLELKYKLSDKKLGFSVVGGFSTFILNDNKVFYELRSETTELGEATNINDVSYSANVGFGLNYNISKTMSLNLDPMFKYQINTFNNTSGDFKPYFIGIYSGVNIKF